MIKSINIIGLGKLGFSLLKALTQLECITHIGLYQRDHQQAIKISQKSHIAKAYAAISELPPCEVTFIATPDDVITQVTSSLAACDHLPKASIIAHFSGLLSSEVLAPLKNKSCYTASLHPMKSFATVTDFNDTYCALEGDEIATIALTRLLTQLGAKPFAIETREKAHYHAAGVFASNYLVTLYQSAKSCLLKAKINEELAHNIVLNLMQNTLNNLAHHQCAKKSLTGPIERGDSATIAKHLQALKGQPLYALYQQLAKNTLPISTHPGKIKEDLATLIESTCD